MDFRTARLDDAPALAALWLKAGVAGEADVALAEIEERLRRDQDLFVVAVDRDREEIVASVMGCYDGHRGWLKRVAVDPSRQRDGVGRAIVEEAERRFAANGVTKLRLAVWSGNEAGLAFWEAAGFELLPEIRYFVKELDVTDVLLHSPEQPPVTH